MLVVRQNKKDQFKIYHIDDSKSVWNQKKKLGKLKTKYYSITSGAVFSQL